MAALADPTRRAILDLLRTRALCVGEMAMALPVSRPAVSQHLRVLSDAGLVTATSRGTRNFYAIDPEGVAALRGYLDAMWSDALAAFAREAERASERGADARHPDVPPTRTGDRP